MPLVLDGTNGVSGVDGTASNPSYEGTDSNTGIFYPAADTVAIGTGGTERVRVDSAGNTGFGVTPSAWASGWRALTIGSLANINSTDGWLQLLANAYYDGANYKYIASASTRATRYLQNGGVHSWEYSAAGTAGNNITFTQAMTLDSNGVLLVGTTAKATYGGNVAEFRGANLATLGGQDTGNFSVFTTNSQAANLGAVIALGGSYTGTTPYAFGAIAARKTNSTDGNAEGYLQFYTTNSGNGIIERARITGTGILSLTQATANGVYIQSGSEVTLANNATITITSGTAGACIILVYEISNGDGGMFWVNYSAVVTKVAGDGSATDAGTTFAVYKNAASHTTTIKNRYGASRTFRIAVYSAQANP